MRYRVWELEAYIANNVGLVSVRIGQKCQDDEV